MRIKRQYERDELEHMAIGRLRRTFGIPRQAHFTKTGLVNQIWKKMKRKFAPERRDLEEMTMGQLRAKFRLPFEKGLTKAKVIDLAVEGEI